jgi:hypothetical protein
MDDHFASNHNSATCKFLFISRPDFSCGLCHESQSFVTKQVSTIIFHLMNVHGVVQEKVLALLSRLYVDSDEEGTDEILVPLVNLFASSESSLGDDELEQLDEHLEMNQLEVDPCDMDCVSQSSDDDNNSYFLECEICEEKNFISARELCLHLYKEHKMGWDRKSELDCRSADYGCYLCTFKCSAKRALKMHLCNDHTHLGNKCRFCPVRFLEHANRDRHQLDQHPDQSDSFYHCPVCQFVSTSTVISPEPLIKKSP